MSEKTTKDKKERTLSLKPGLVSSTNTKNSRSPRVSTVVVESRRGRVSQTRKPVAPSVRCLLYTSPSPRDRTRSRMPSSA